MSRLTNKGCNKYEDFVFSLRHKLTTSSEINDGIFNYFLILLQGLLNFLIFYKCHH